VIVMKETPMPKTSQTVEQINAIQDPKKRAAAINQHLGGFFSAVVFPRSAEVVKLRPAPPKRRNYMAKGETVVTEIERTRRGRGEGARRESNFRPTSGDVDRAVVKARRGYRPDGLIDPAEDRRYSSGNFWRAALYAPGREEPAIGLGDSMAEAVVFAWFVAQDPDVLIDGELTPENWTDYSPYTIPPGYRLMIERGGPIPDPHDPLDE
jgi:hypothetical protein